MPTPDSHTRILERLRILLLGLVVLSAAGLTAELLLMEHWEEWRQWIPLVLLVSGGLGSMLILVRPDARVIRGVRTVLALAVLSGLVGTVFHYGSNVELEREIAPGLSGVALFRAAMGGGTPTLAPGAMIQFGLLGLFALYRHPARHAP